MRDALSLAAQHVPILIVDNDPDCRLLVRDALTQLRLPNDVFEACSGEQALAFLRREKDFAHAPRPGLLFMDIEMPGIGGHETLRLIRRERRFADIAIVMMTGLDTDDDKRLAMANGANSFAHKPARAADFLRVVIATADYWLRVHRFPAADADPLLSAGSAVRFGAA